MRLSTFSSSARPLIYAALGVVLFVAADRILSAALWSRVIRSGFRYSVMYRSAVNADILILGNSRGMSLVDWPYLEQRTRRSAFNLSFNELPSALSNVLFQDYLERNRPPSLLLLEVTTVLGKDSLVNELKLYERASPRLAGFIGTRYPSLDWGMTLSRLYAFNGELALRALYYGNRTDRDWLVDGQISEEVIRYTDGMPSPPWDMPNEANWAGMAEIARIAKSRGIAVRAIVAPYLAAYVRKVPNAKALIHEMSVRLGVPILDYSQAVDDLTQLADRHHLNRRGSRMFTDRLIADGVIVPAAHK